LFRALQGLTGAALPALCQMLIYDIYPPREVGRALSYYSIGVLSGTVLGPPLGGFITDIASWRWIFFVNVPIGAVTVAAFLVLLPKIERTERRSFDYLGFGLLAIGLLCLQLFLDRGQNKDWFASTEIVTELAIAITALYMFLAHSFTAKQPFVDLALFK